MNKFFTTMVRCDCRARHQPPISKCKTNASALFSGLGIWHLALRHSLVIITLILSHSLQAFPPVPHHTIYGTVRDEFGNPLQATAEVIFETASGVRLKAKVSPGIEPGVNYQLEIPMDAGITSDLYKPTALRPTVAFKITVKIGQRTYLPMEMAADFSHLGEPSQETLLNLTLGEDLDGDGIPDAWERALLAARKVNGTLQDVNPNDDADGDSLSNLDEYLAGTYAFDDKNGFTLKILRTENENPILEFMAIRGRTYTVLGSSDLNQWVPAQFRIIAGTTGTLQAYYAADTRVLQMEAISPPGQRMLIFKLMAQ
jgi:hypothetical protein